MYCYVSGCPNSSSSSKEGKKSRPIVQIFFRAPEDETLFKLWQKAVPESDHSFSRDDKLCEFHFQKSEVVLYTETKLPNGNVRRLPASEPKLKPGTIPSIFPTSELIFNVTTADTSKSGNQSESQKQKGKRKYPIDDVDNSSSDNEKFTKGRARRNTTGTQDKQISTPSEKRRKTIKGEALLVTNAASQGGSELMLDKSELPTNEGGTTDIPTQPCGIRLVPLEMLLESKSFNKTSASSTPAKNYKKTPIKKAKDNAKSLSNTPKPANLLEKKVKKVQISPPTPVPSATRVSARISSKIKQGKMPKYLQGTSMDVDRISDDIDEEKPNIEELERNNVIELYHEGSEYPEVITIKTEPDDDQQELIDPVTGELNTSVNSQNTEELPQDIFAENGVHPRITGVISLSDLSMTNAISNDDTTAERVADLLEEEIERITEGRTTPPEKEPASCPDGPSTEETSTTNKVAEQESSTIQKEGCDLEREVERIVEGNDLSPKSTTDPLVEAEPSLVDNSNPESNNLPSDNGQTALEEERTSDKSEVPLTNDDTSVRQPEGENTSESGATQPSGQDSENVILDTDIEKEIERIVEGKISESEVVPSTNDVASEELIASGSSPVKDQEKNNNANVVEERTGSVDNIEEEIAKLLEESPTTLDNTQAASNDEKHDEIYLSSDSDQDPTWVPGPIEVSDENDTDPGCGLDSHNSEDEKEKDKENISKKKQKKIVPKSPKSTNQKQHQVLTRVKNKSSTKKVSFQPSPDASPVLFTQETIQQILKQIKLPLTTPVTVRIAQSTKEQGKNKLEGGKVSLGSVSTVRKTSPRGGVADDTISTNAIVLSLDKDGKPLKSYRTIISYEKRKRCEGLLGLRMFEGLGKIKKCFQFRTEVKSLSDDIQYKKLCYITKECLREVRDSKNAKTNVGKLTIRLRRKKNTPPEIPSINEQSDSQTPTNLPIEDSNINVFVEETPETVALECVTVDSTVEDNYEFVPGEEKEG